MFPNILNYYLR